MGIFIPKARRNLARTRPSGSIYDHALHLFLYFFFFFQDYIRSSLVWSMLKQMLSDDRNEAVREAVTKSLGLVVAFMENVDKYQQVRTRERRTY